MALLPSFRRAAQHDDKVQQPVSARRRSTVVWHRLVRSLIYLLAWIFLVLVVIGNTYDRPVLRQTYFIKLNLSNIIPRSVPNAVLINSIARSIGLHDFYQVGLWNFCEGYDDTGITHCSRPKTLYAFDPVKILLNELLAGATIALPAEISDALRIARTASHWMFGLFLSATVLCFVAIFLSPLAVSSRPPQAAAAYPLANDDTSTSPSSTLRPHRRCTFVLLRAFPLLLFTFVIAVLTVVASVIATVMFSIFRNVFVKNGVDLNIQADLGARMLAFMWIASACTLIGFIVQTASCCSACCGGRSAAKARRELGKPGLDGTGTSTPSEMREKDRNIPDGPADGGIKKRLARLRR
ncbi:SUR7/PalI family-domain-containing protein [Thermoascus aurantiacus ATCC 26904]